MCFGFELYEVIPVKTGIYFLVNKKTCRAARGRFALFRMKEVQRNYVLNSLTANTTDRSRKEYECFSFIIARYFKKKQSTHYACSTASPPASLVDCLG
jgi:hypothetical protein